MSSKFIIVEGPDFCGKSSQIELIESSLWYMPYNIFFTREPGSYLPDSSEICEIIRQKILNNKNSVEEEAMLFAESRYHHTKEIVDLLTKADNNIVISDRYIVSSLAYQGYAQYLGRDIIYDLNEPSLKLLRDHNIEIHCIKFNITQEEWEKRRNERLQKEEADSIEQKNIHEHILDFFSDERIFNYYTENLPMTVYDIDASKSIITVYLDFLEVVQSIINN